MKKFITCSALFLLTCVAALAQVNFKVSYKEVSPTEVDIIFTGKADAGWHVYSTNIPADGPNPATFGVDKKDGVELVGGLKPGKGAKTSFDPMFEMNITYFEGSCTFTQRVRLTKPVYSLEGYLEFSACNDQNCLPPTTVSCKLAGKDGPGAEVANDKAAAKDDKADQAVAESAEAMPAAETTAVATDSLLQIRQPQWCPSAALMA